MNKWSRIRAWARSVAEYPDAFIYDVLAAIVTLMAVAVLVLHLFFAAGCTSATREVSQRAQAVQISADAGKEQLKQALDTGDVGPKAQPHVVVADQAFDKIKHDAAAVLSAVPGLQDRQSVWVGLAKLWGVIVLVALVLGASIYWGWGALLRPIFHAAGRLIPADTWSEAKLHVEALADGSVAKLREAVASRRTADPAYDAAFRLSKAQAEAESKTA